MLGGSLEITKFFCFIHGFLRVKSCFLQIIFFCVSKQYCFEKLLCFREKTKNLDFFQKLFRLDVSFHYRVETVLDFFVFSKKTLDNPLK